jgi:hypothetical protein
MKIFFIFCSLTFMCIHGSMAQFSIEPTRKYEGTVEYQKTKQHATILDFNYPERDLENALEEYVEKQGGKVKINKGYFYAKSVKLHERENRQFDVYYKVTGSGKGDDARSTVYIILGEPGENILLRDTSAHNHSGKAAAASAGAAGFFGSLGSAVGDYDLDKKIKAQESAVLNTEKKLTDLDRKKLSLEKELEDIRKETEMQESELEKNRTLLAQFKEEKELKKKKKN